MAHLVLERFHVTHFKYSDFDASFEVEVDGQVPDLTGWSAVCQWRRKESQDMPDLEFSTANGSIAALDDSGIIRLFKPRAEFANLALGKYNTEVMIISPSNVAIPYAVGTFEILNQNTRL